MGDTIEITCIQRSAGICEIDPLICANLNDNNTAEDVINISSYDNVKNAISFDILSPTNLTRVPTFILHKFPRLNYLRLMNTGITSLHAESFVAGHKLEQIDLRYNQITDVPANIFANLRRLENVNLAHNQIATINSGAFDQVPALKILIFSHNLLQTIQYGSFTGARKLTELYLENNNIRNIEDGALDLPQMEILSLRDNELVEIPNSTFANLTKLEKIDLSNNQLVQISNLFGNCRNLYSLSLSNNVNLNGDLFELIEKIPNLSYLYLANTGFRADNLNKLNTSDNYALTHVDLSNNNLSTPDIFILLKKFKSLRTIVLNNNQFTHLNHIAELKTLFPRLDNIQLKQNTNLQSEWISQSRLILTEKRIKFYTDQ